MKKLLFLLALPALLCCCSGRSGRQGAQEPADGAQNQVPSEPQNHAPAALSGADAEPASAVLPAVQAVPQANPPPAPFRIGDFDFASRSLVPSRYIAGEHNLDSAHAIYDHSRLFFLGFSEDGKLAFLKELELEGTGFVQAGFYIQDLVTDEIVCSVEEPDYTADDMSAALLAERRGADIDAALERFGIRPDACDFLPLPYAGGSKRLELRVRITDTGKLLHEMFRIIDYDCIAVDGSGQEKTITSKQSVAVENVYACGCIKSPFEDRLAIVIAEQTFGFEGYDLRYSVLGCSLDAGFGGR